MAKPTNRKEFTEFCLRALGKPVINIEVDEEQVDDRIDQALSYYADYHFDGSERTYYKHMISQEDIDNQYIFLPENIIGAVRIFPQSSLLNSAEKLFDVQYQLVAQELYAFTSGSSLIPYYMLTTHLSMIEEILIPTKAIRFSRHKNKLYIDTNWNKYKVGDYFIVEAHEVIDPEIYTDVWSDRWLQNYATCLIKEQWGSNLTKHIGVPMLGGVQFNGDRILTDAQNQRMKLEEEMMTKYALPPLDFFQ